MLYTDNDYGLRPSVVSIVGEGVAEDSYHM